MRDSTGTGQFQTLMKGSRVKFSPSSTAPRDSLRPRFSALMVKDKIDNNSLIVCHAKNLTELNASSGPWCVVEWVEDGDVAALTQAAEEFPEKVADVWKGLMARGESLRLRDD